MRRELAWSRIRIVRPVLIAIALLAAALSASVMNSGCRAYRSAAVDVSRSRYSELQVAWEASVGVRGTRDAERDVSLGQFVQLGVGLPSPAEGEYWEVLETRFGIQHDRMAGCMVTSPLASSLAKFEKLSLRVAAVRRPLRVD